MLWSATLLAIGVTALATWFIGADLLRSPRIVRCAHRGGLTAWRLRGRRDVFHEGVQVGNRSQPAGRSVLLAAVVTKYIREPRQPLVLLAGGQREVWSRRFFKQVGVGLHPVHFDHNAVYHIIQGIALYVFYRGATGLLKRGRPEQSREIGQLMS